MDTSAKHTNKEIVQLLRNLSAALQIKQANRFRIIAYDKAADAVEYLSRELKDLWKEGKLQSVDGIGPGIGGGLSELFEKDESPGFEEILEGIPPTVFVLMNVPGIGPKKAFKLVQTFQLVNPQTVVADLKKVAKAGRIRELEGFGEKSEADIIESLEIYQRQDRREERMPLPLAGEIANKIIEYMKQLEGVEDIEALGSLRRQVATIGDIDIAVMADPRDYETIINHFLAYPGKLSNEGSGDRKASILAAGNIRIDLRVQDKETWGTMLQYFTGSKAHNIKLREYALKKGLSISEYGMKVVRNEELKIKHEKPKTKNHQIENEVNKPKPSQVDLMFETEEKLYSHLGLQYIPPEIREGTNEIEIAEENEVPQLVTIEDIKGDFHLHSSYDLKPSHDLGRDSYADMAKKARELKYSYIGFSEHNPKVSGLSTEDIMSIMKARKHEIVTQMSSENLKYYIGLEVDILPSGELALPTEAFEFVDYLIVSIHSSFRQSAEEMTRRILKAFSYPKVRIFGHPTARLIQKRDGISANWEKIFAEAKKKKVALEINSSPLRLDLPDILVRQAGASGNKFIVSTDAHSAEGMSIMQYGVSVARRGWLSSDQVVNTWEPSNFENWLLT